MTYRRAVEAAQKAIEGIDLPPELKSVAFQEVLRAALGSPMPGVSTTPTPSPNTEHTPVALDASNGHSRAALFATRVGVPTELVDRILVFTAETFRLEVEMSRLPDSKAAASEVLALLTCAVRQLAFGDEATTADEMRKVCEEFGKYDQANFAYKLKKLAPEFVRIAGTERKFTFALTRPGIERVRQLLQQLAGVEVS